MTEGHAEQSADRTLVLMAALVALAAALVAGLTLLFDGVAWYEAAVPCLLAGGTFVLTARWSLRKVSADSLAALRIMTASIGIHFGVVVIGGLAFVLAADFNAIAVFGGLLLAFAICQPLTTLALRRRIASLPDGSLRDGSLRDGARPDGARPDGSGRGGASPSNSNLNRTPFAEASA